MIWILILLLAKIRNPWRLAYNYEFVNRSRKAFGLRNHKVCNCFTASEIDVGRLEWFEDHESCSRSGYSVASSDSDKDSRIASLVDVEGSDILIICEPRCFAEVDDLVHQC